jgi:cell wall-associated NlpC family hydrolase
VRQATTSRALHALSRLLGVTAVAAALVAGDAAAGAPALAAPAAATTSAVASPRVRPIKRATRDARGSSRKQPASARSKRAGSRSTADRSTSRRPFARTARSSFAPGRTARVAAASELPPMPVFTLPDLASLFPNDTSLQPGTALTTATNRPFTSIGRSASALLDQMVARARSQLGTRYVLGGSQPGDALDCSSFARYAMEALGIKLPRTAAQQAQVGTPVPRDRSQLRAGDLLTFGLGRRASHVGIYLGEGRFIHASVKSGQVIETTFERNGTLLRRWQGARRLIATGDGTDAAGG